LTLGPLYPLEAGLDIYPAFATGRFAWRTAPYLDVESRKALGVISGEDLDPYLSESPPDGILVGFNRELEEQFIQYAKQNGYHPLGITPELRLWVRPMEDAP
jgi:hypothetical protein